MSADALPVLGPTDVLIGALPALAWLWWIRREDAREPEPWRIVFAVFLLGACAALAIVWARPRVEFWFLGGRFGMSERVADAFVVTALCEETVKFLAFAAGALWSREWDEPLDGIVYGSAAGLGFAAVENAFFIAATGQPELVVARAFTSTLAHLAFTGSLGFFVGLARLHRDRLFATWLAAGVVFAVGAHGVYDFIALANPVQRVVLIGSLMTLLGAIAVLIRWSRARSAEYHPTA